MDFATADRIATDLIEALAPYTHRIRKGGSLRRLKDEVKDIELIHIPMTGYRPIDLFNNLEEYSLFDEALLTLIDDGILVRDEETPRWGDKYKRLVHCASGIVIETFAARRENWGLIYALRTGPDEFNKLVVRKGWQGGGAMPVDMEMRDGFLWRNGIVVETPTEESFFGALGLPVWPAHQRTAHVLETYLRSGLSGRNR